MGAALLLELMFVVAMVDLVKAGTRLSCNEVARPESCRESAEI